MEYFMLNYMLALLSEIITYKALQDFLGFETADFIQAVSRYPNSIMPEYRRQRLYMSSILSKVAQNVKSPFDLTLHSKILR